jgi:type IV pilus assembly protein PilA
MIVVAIIGILSAIAIPNYRTYTTRAHVTEGLQLAGNAKTAVVEYYLSFDSTFPTGGTALVNNRLVGLSDPMDITGKFVTSVGVDDGGTIVVIFSAEDAHLNGKSITFAPTANVESVEWICRSPGPAPIENQYLPHNCRT